MKILRDISSLRLWRKQQSQSIGFVPTMGALHAGHLSLVKHAQGKNDVSIVSLFVNPKQFNDPKDFRAYPQTLDRDLLALEKMGVDAVFIPQADEIYADGYKVRIQSDLESMQLEGQFRPGHFEGVLTVVMKLLNLVLPSCAYFGEKDYEQCLHIQQMVESLFCPVEICICPTVREESGLALSSRNERLSKEGRIHAANIYCLLQKKIPLKAVREELESLGFTVEYLEEIQGKRFIACYYESIRLIDHVSI